MPQMYIKAAGEAITSYVDRRTSCLFTRANHAFLNLYLSNEPFALLSERVRDVDGTSHTKVSTNALDSAFIIP